MKEDKTNERKIQRFFRHKEVAQMKNADLVAFEYATEVETINNKEAEALGAANASGTADKYYVKGYVTEVANEKYGNITIVDVTLSNVIANMSFQSTKKKLSATILSCCRQGIFFIPLVLILPSVINLKGVQLTQPLSDTLTCLFSIPFFIYFIRHLNTKMSENL